MAGASATTPAGSWFSRNVVVLGVISFFTDMASEMAMPLLPVFLLGMGGGAMALGWIEGLSDAVAALLKLAAGRWADRAGRNRPFVVAGYVIASAAKPLVALATSPWHVLAVRCADRVGKGIRTSPRDALISATVAPNQLGAAYSLHRAMDHAGAIAGPLLCIALIAWVTTDIPTIFWLTAIPSGLAVLAAWFGIKEAALPAPMATRTAVTPSRPLLRFLIPLGLFTLGNASEVFLLLKVGNIEEDLYIFPLTWAALHVVKVISSVPGGKLSDRLGRKPVIAAGWLLYAGVFVGLAFVEEQWAVWALMAAYGVYFGLTEGAQRALVAEIAPKRGQGTAFGWYYLTMGILALAASVMFGVLWEQISPTAAFLVSAGLAVAATVLLLVARDKPGRAVTRDFSRESRQAGA